MNLKRKVLDHGMELGHRQNWDSLSSLFSILMTIFPSHFFCHSNEKSVKVNIVADFVSRLSE